MSTATLNNQIELDKIWFKDRLRVEYGDLEELARDIHLNGQLQDVLVREPNDEEWEIIKADPKMKNVEFILVDGGRRFIAIEFLHKKEISVPELDIGKIGVKFRGAEIGVKALILEYRANEVRLDFSWQERAGYIRRVHQLEKLEDPEWTVKNTAEVLDMSHMTVYKYLELTSDKDILADERIQGADTFNTAYKQYQIVKEHKNREALVEHREKREAKKREKKEEALASGAPIEEIEVKEELIEIPDFVHSICQQGDCTQWIKKFPENSLDFVHWDPPYGGEQGGGAFTSFTKIDDSYEYAMDLFRSMVPELYRVLRPGRWVALWCHPTYVQDIGRFLGGHVWSPTTNTCANCEKPWDSKHLRYYCPAGRDWCFWVNPYPNIWYKVNRGSDGHEIKRFLNNDYETFLFACAMKAGAEDPILIRTDRSNVFTFPMVTKNERRHVMHKPPDLLEEIISCISIPGEIGCDPSFGSGSSLEAGLRSRRRMVGCELENENVLGAAEALVKTVLEFGVKPYNLDFSL